jgi:hypothetical protein
MTIKGLVEWLTVAERLSSNSSAAKKRKRKKHQKTKQEMPIETTRYCSYSLG